MVIKLNQYLEEIKATVEQYKNTEDFSHIVQNEDLILWGYINDVLEPIGDVLNCALNRAVFQKTITRTIPDIKYILRSFKPFSIKMDFAEVEPKMMEFIYLNKLYTLFIYLLSELVD